MYEHCLVWLPHCITGVLHKTCKTYNVGFWFMVRDSYKSILPIPLSSLATFSGLSSRRTFPLVLRPRIDRLPASCSFSFCRTGGDSLAFRIKCIGNNGLPPLLGSGSVGAKGEFGAG